MKIIKDRIVKERLPISQCQAGDHLFVPYSKNNSWQSLGQVEIVKIKTIPNGFIQLKYRKRYFNGSTKVLKTDLPPYALVERTRKADGRDGTPIKECAAEVIT